MGLFDRLKQGLAKTRAGIVNGLDAVFGDYSEVDEDFLKAGQIAHLAEVNLGSGLGDVIAQTGKGMLDFLFMMI